MLAPRARYQVLLAWDQLARGAFRFGISQLGGSDVMNATNWGQSFGGANDDITAPGDGTLVDTIETQRGRQDDLQLMQQGTATVGVIDPIGKFNRKNPASIIYGKIRPLVPGQILCTGPSVSTLTLSGTPGSASVYTTPVLIAERKAAANLGVSPVTFSLAGNTAAGNHLILIGRLNSGTLQTAFTVTDTQGNIWQVDRLVNDATVGLNLVVASCYLTNALTVADTISVSWSGVASLNARIEEWSGLSPTAWADQTATNKATVGSTAIDFGTTAVTTQANELVFGAVALSQSGTLTPGGAFTALTPNTSAIQGVYQIVAAAAAYNPTATTTVSTRWIAATVTYKAAATTIVTSIYGYGRAQALASLLSANQGWVAFNVAYGFASTLPLAANVYLLDWRDDAGNLLGLYYDATADVWTAARLAGGAGASAVSPVQTFKSGDAGTIIMAWTGGTLSLSVNGSPFATVGNVSVPSLAAALFDIGSQAGAQLFPGTINWAACGTGTLADADAAAIAGFQAATPTFVMFPSAASVSGLLDGDIPAMVKASVTRTIFFGFLDTAEWVPSGRSGRATLSFIDLFAWLDQTKPVIATMTSTTTGAVIGALLDYVNWREPSLRSLGVGDTIASFSANGSKTCLQIIEDLLLSERGVFFISGAGVATYLARTQISRTALAQVTNVMSGISSGIDRTRLKTRWTVTPPSTNNQVATATPESNTYGLIDDAVTPPYVASDATALSLANYLLSRTKAPAQPVWEVPLRQKSEWLLAQMLDRELVDHVTLEGDLGGTPAGDYLIEQIGHQIANGGTSHATTWRCTEMPGLSFTFGVSALGGTDVLSY